MYCAKRLSPDRDDLEKIAKKHSVVLESHLYYYKSRYFKVDSKLSAIMIEQRIPQCIRLELEKLIPKYKPEFELAMDLDELEAHDGQIIGRADRYKDFDMLIKFINNQKVSATKAGRLLGKSSLIKFYKTVGYEEVFQNDILI